MTNRVLSLRAVLMYTFAGKAFAVFGFLLVGLLLARMLPQQQVGTFFLGMSWAGFLALLAQAGLNQTIYRTLAAITKHEQRAAVSRTLLLVLSFSIILGALNWLAGAALEASFSTAFAEFKAEDRLAVSLWIIASAMQSVCGEILRARHDNLFTVVYGSPGGVLGGTLNILIVIIVMIGCLILGIRASVAECIFLMAAAQAVCVVLAISRLRALISYKALGASGKWETGALSIPLIGSAVVTYLLAQSDVWLIGGWHSDFTASYGVGSSLAKYVSAANILIYAAIPAIVVQFAADGRNRELSALLGRTARISFICAVVVVLISAVLGKFLIGKFYGNTYSDAYYFLLTLSFGHVVNSFVGNPLLVAVAKGADRVILAINITTTVVAILTGYFLGTFFGPIGVAAAYSIAYAVNGLALARYVNKNFGISTAVNFRSGSYEVTASNKATS